MQTLKHRIGIFEGVNAKQHIIIAHSCRLARSHKTKTAILQNKLDKTENQLFPPSLPRAIYIKSLEEQLNEETKKVVQGQMIRGWVAFYEENEKSSTFFI